MTGLIQLGWFLIAVFAAGAVATFVLGRLSARRQPDPRLEPDWEDGEGPR